MPLVLSPTGELGNEANTFYKRLASLLTMKWNNPYNSRLCWLRCRLSFFLLRSSMIPIRGASSSCGHAVITPTAVDLVNSECNIAIILKTNLNFNTTCNFVLLFTFHCIIKPRLGECQKNNKEQQEHYKITTLIY